MARKKNQNALLKTLQQFLKKQQRKKPKTLLAYGWVLLSGMALALLSQWNAPQRESSSPDIIAKGLSLPCRLEKVYDGDTVAAECEGQRVRIRLSGIDAPEMQQKPYGEQARQVLQKRLANGHFTLESGGADFYRRTLGELYVGAENINLSLVRDGHAVAYADKSTPKKYREAEAEAKRKKRGVWAKAGLHQDPKQWRRYCKDAPQNSPAVQC